MPLLWSYSLYQTSSSEVVWGKINILAPTVCTKLVPSRFFGLNKRLAPRVRFKIDFSLEIREYATFLLLQFVPELFSRGNICKINVLASIVCFKIDFFLRSGSMPHFCSYCL